MVSSRARCYRLVYCYKLDLVMQADSRSSLVVSPLHFILSFSSPHQSILGVQCEVQKQLKAFVTLERFDQLYGSTITSCQQARDKEVCIQRLRVRQGGQVRLEGWARGHRHHQCGQRGWTGGCRLGHALYLENLHFTIGGWTPTTS